jgi:hypothetical protein
MPLTEAELWKVYANKIKNDYLQQSDFGSQNKIFIPPINSQAVLASGPIKQSQTNFGVFRASDPLLEVDNPSFTPSNDGYAQRCLNYLRAVQLVSNVDKGITRSFRLRTSSGHRCFARPRPKQGRGLPEADRSVRKVSGNSEEGQSCLAGFL